VAPDQATADNRLLEIEGVVAVLGHTHTDRLQAAVLAHRLGELLKLAILKDLTARVKPVRDGLSRGRQSDAT
jgi:hypothetical protein